MHQNGSTWSQKNGALTHVPYDAKLSPFDAVKWIATCIRGEKKKPDHLLIFQRQIQRLTLLPSCS
jgi:hypothetical protein